MNKTNIPLPIKILSIFYYVSAGFSVLAAAAVILLGSKIAPVILIETGEEAPAALGIIVAFVVTISLAAGALNFFVARGLRRAKNWARIYVKVVSVISIIAILGSFASMRMGGMTISLLLNGLIFYYIFFDRKVKEFFANK